jgi:hypothetical protein
MFELAKINAIDFYCNLINPDVFDQPLINEDEKVGYS